MSTASPAVETPSTALYRAVWRWHFYAGLLCLPFLLVLAVTGGIYVFKDEIDAAIHRSMLIVEPPSAAVPVSAQADAALAAYPGGTLSRYVSPAAPDRSAQFGVTTAEGENLTVYVDPGTASVLGALGDEDHAMWVVKKLHSLEYLGVLPNRIMEIVGGWTIVLTVTGVFLWWPRGGLRRPRGGIGGVMTVRGTPRKRVFWRDLHAVTGSVAAAGIFFLALSGMPWSGKFGGWLNQIATETGTGYPVYVWDAVPTSTVPLKEVGSNAGWTVEGSAVPLSEATGAASLTLDQAVAAVEGMGIAPGYELALPGDDPTGVFSAMIFPDDLALQRVIHLDRYSGEALVDVGVDDYGWVARAVELGISIHMGQAFGLANQLLMLAICLAIATMAVAAGAMWWKRKPAGRLGAPQAPEARTMAAVLLIVLPFAVLFPLVGLSLVAMLALDWLVIRRIPRLKAALS